MGIRKIALDIFGIWTDSASILDVPASHAHTRRRCARPKWAPPIGTVVAPLVRSRGRGSELHSSTGVIAGNNAAGTKQPLYFAAAITNQGGWLTERDIDQQLVARAQRGEKHAFELLVAKYQRRLLRLISRLVRDPAEAEDVAQEAFIKAYRALPQFRGEAAFYTWLYRIGVNSAKNFLASQSRKPPSSTEKDAEEAETFEDAGQLRDINTPESMLQSRQVADAVNAAMNRLPGELRTAVTLREIEGLSYDEIAEVMNCPIGTVRSRIFRAREAIATELRPLLGTANDKRW